MSATVAAPVRDPLRDLIVLGSTEDTPGTAALLRALDAVAEDPGAVQAVVRCLAQAGADGHTVLSGQFLAAVLAGQGARPEQATAALTAAVEAGHVMRIDGPATSPPDPSSPVPDPASPVPEADAVFALTEIGTAEADLAAAVRRLHDAGRLRLEDGIASRLRDERPDADRPVVDLSVADVVTAAAALNQVDAAGSAGEVVIVGDSALPPPAGPGRVVLDLYTAAGALGLPITTPDTAPAAGTPGAVIAGLCAAVRAGTLPPVDDQTREVMVIHAADGAEAAHRAGQLVRDSLPRALDLTGTDVTVVTPIRRGPAGATALRAAGLPALTAREAIGKTWPGVVAVLPPEACGVLSRPLVYAMFSLATRHLSVVHAAGPTLAHAVRSTAARPRRTRLAELLRVDH